VHNVDRAGATNMLTGAAGATIQSSAGCCCCRVIFLRDRNVAPVLQQLDSPSTQDVSVNDCFRPVSPLLGPNPATGTDSDGFAGGDAGADFTRGDGRRNTRPAPDVQAQAFDFPEDFF